MFKIRSKKVDTHYITFWSETEALGEEFLSEQGPVLWYLNDDAVSSSNKPKKFPWVTVHAKLNPHWLQRKLGDDVGVVYSRADDRSLINVAFGVSTVPGVQHILKTLEDIDHTSLLCDPDTAKEITDDITGKAIRSWAISSGFSIRESFGLSYGNGYNQSEKTAAIGLNASARDSILEYNKAAGTLSLCLSRTPLTVNIYNALEASWKLMGGQRGHLICPTDVYNQLALDLQRTEISHLSPAQAAISIGLGQSAPALFDGSKPLDTGSKVTRTYMISMPELQTAIKNKEIKVTNELSASQVDAAAMVQRMRDNRCVDPRLHHDQRIAVATHRSTELGYVSAMDTGRGKTIPTLIGMNESLPEDPTKLGEWRSLVVCEASVRRQWVKEADEWLDDRIEVVEITASKDAKIKKIIKPLKQKLKENNPILFIVSYNLTQGVLAGERTPVGKILDDIHFANLIADEGRALRGSGAQQRALWQLRQKADVAAVLCATPVLKNFRDLAKFMAWARNEPAHDSKAINDIFRKSLTAERIHEWYDWWGPTLIRSSQKSAEALGTVPRPEVYPMEIMPSEVELEVFEALNGQVKEALTAIIETYEARGNPLSAEEKKQLSGKQLSIHQLSKAAASDVRLLKGSDAEVAQILRASGMLSIADTFESNKFTFAIQAIKDLTNAGGQTVVFTEFRQTANWLADALARPADDFPDGIEVALFTGQMSHKIREEHKDRFVAGDIPVLVGTSAAYKGLNLQNANVALHYDLGWTAEILFQRCGRILRVGSPNEVGRLLFPITKGTFDEKTFAVTVARAGLTGATVASSIEEFGESEKGIILKGMQPFATPVALNDGGQSKLLALSKALVS